MVVVIFLFWPLSFRRRTGLQNLSSEQPCAQRMSALREFSAVPRCGSALKSRLWKQRNVLHVATLQEQLASGAAKRCRHDPVVLFRNRVQPGGGLLEKIFRYVVDLISRRRAGLLTSLWQWLVGMSAHRVFLRGYDEIPHARTRLLVLKAISPFVRLHALV